MASLAISLLKPQPTTFLSICAKSLVQLLPTQATFQALSEFSPSGKILQFLADDSGILTENTFSGPTAAAACTSLQWQAAGNDYNTAAQNGPARVSQVRGGE